MPKFSANLWYLFQELEMLDRIDAAAAAGFRGVEYHFPYQWNAADLTERLAEHGLEQVQINAPPGDWQAGDRGLAGLPGRAQEFRDSIEHAIDYAKALNCPLVHVMAGIVDWETDLDAAIETLAENLNTAAGACKKVGIGVLIEALNPKDVPGYLIGDTAKALSVIEAAGKDNLFLQYDLYHGAINGEDLLAAVRDNLGRIRHIQVAGVTGRGEPDAEDRGGIDFPALFDAIDGLGYQGWIGCEYSPRAGTVEGLGWAKDYGIG